MPDLDVGSLTVPQLLERLHGRHYLVPMFQRQFVWTAAKAAELADSVLKRRPIGMLTLWEQPPDSDLLLNPVDLPDTGAAVYFAPEVDQGSSITQYAILDGRQRSTALAMVFGGLRQTDQNRKFAGRFFLDLDAGVDEIWVKFIKTRDVIRRNIEAPTAALAEGLMPLDVAADVSGAWPLGRTWDSYKLKIATGAIYPAHSQPEQALIDKRTERIRDAQAGLSEVRLATYTVGAAYDLGDICDIFETLNTTGVKVSTVDLIHSWLYAESDQKSISSDPDYNTPFDLRGWIDDLGQSPGAEGWASSDRKPEWVAQIVTASYVGMLRKPGEPRPIRGASGAISSIKSGDLLRVPFKHWRSVALEQERFASLIGNFQETVASAYFPGAECPYPATVSVYMGIAWSREVEEVNEDKCWGNLELKALFRAFFWRNALAGRYDQGFLTQVGSDLSNLRSTLRRRADFGSVGQWMQDAENALTDMIKDPLPERSQVLEWLQDGSIAGARRLALRLPLWAKASKDIVSGEDIRFPHRTDVEMHHIWPKAWLSNNKTAKLRKFIAQMNDRGLKVVDSPANLVPLSRDSNQRWKATNPGQILLDESIVFEDRKSLFEGAFIDKSCFEILQNGDPKDFEEFLGRRAELIADRVETAHKILLH